MAHVGRGQPIPVVMRASIYAASASTTPPPVSSQLFGAVGMPVFCLGFAWLIVLLWVTCLSAATVTLAWDAPTLNQDGSPLTDLDGYHLYRCSGTGCTNFTSLVRVGLVLTYQDTTITLGTFYRYRIHAVNVPGLESLPSAIIAIGPPPPPGQPTFQ